MAPVTIFCSTQACPVVLGLALTMRQRGHNLLSLRRLPTPRAARLASLRLERAELQQDERTIRWTLAQYADHRRLPDACHESGLRADLDATISRLRAVEATLKTMEGEPRND